MNARAVTDRSSCSASRHGTESAYCQGCRCDDAREDRRIKVKHRLHGVHRSPYTTVTGTSRRLQALATLGWSCQLLAPRLGSSAQLMERYRTGRHPRIRQETATQIARLYDQLWATPGPCQVSRERAARAGWSRPQLWDDDTIDNPHAEPVEDAPVRSPRVDLGEVEHLRTGGMSLSEIAQRLGVHPGSIERAEHRAQQRGDRTPEGLASYWAAVAAGQTPAAASEDEQLAAHERDWAPATSDEQEWVDA